ncbi:DMT family transporter [Conexibacter sp. SYSU D00693]|uniref:DMT family transporter n=1 Tax=Conexibacter sp. SYSU D00693 TaxID=2812560 RepID=UPI00196B35A8|nr:DMT family transporter [Conexibacter sp. SYSU D00693]
MSTRGAALFAAVAVVWGLPYFFIKVAVDDGVPPAFVAWIRVVIAVVVLAPLAWRAGALRGLRPHTRAIVVYALFEVVVPFPLISFGEQRIASSLAAILIAALPLVIALIALRVDPEERPTPRRLAGLVVGLAGVVLLVGVDVAGSADELVGALAVLVATVGYAIGPMVVKRHLGHLPPLGPVTASFAASALMLLPFALLDLPGGDVTDEAVASLVALGLLCTALAFVLFFALIAEVGPSRASVITYLNPAVAVLLGVLVLDEALTAAAAGGLALILAGSWVATGGVRRPRPVQA